MEYLSVFYAAAGSKGNFSTYLHWIQDGFYTNAHDAFMLTSALITLEKVKYFWLTRWCHSHCLQISCMNVSCCTSLFPQRMVYVVQWNYCALSFSCIHMYIHIYDCVCVCVFVILKLLFLLFTCELNKFSFNYLCILPWFILCFHCSYVFYKIFL